MSLRWFVASVQPGLSDVAKRHLDRYSIESSYLRVKDADEKLVSYFPGYLLIRMECDELSELVNIARECRGIGHFLPKHLADPLPLPRGFVESLLEAANAGELDEKSEDCSERFKAGEYVRVISGTWFGKTFQVSRYRKGSLLFTTSLLGQDFEVSIPQHQVERAVHQDHRDLTVAAKLRGPQFSAASRWRHRAQHSSQSAA